MRDTGLRLEVRIASGSYPILIGPGLLGRPEWRDLIPGTQVLVVSNETVAPLYLDTVLAGLKGFETDTLILPDGERYKTLETVNLIWNRLIELRFDRESTIAALGGGVVGDMSGFAAACYRRGVHFLPLPTTLLAQTDASVGGKTGVNHGDGKNLVGAFHQPCAVISDTDTLKTLPERELRAGLAEVIKYGIIGDNEFTVWLEENLPAILRLDPDALAFAIERSCRSKATVVMQDEREKGIRALLNLGHTFAHAIETATGYSTWLHGEAVGLGLRLAARLSARMNLLDEAALQRIEALLDGAGLPAALPEELDAASCIELMYGDKKVQAGRLRLVLLRDIGDAFLSDDVDTDLLHGVLEDARC